jgi:hypothetical protein
LKRSGIIGMDGEMLAAFLADREGGKTPTGLEEDAFIKWIES